MSFSAEQMYVKGTSDEAVAEAITSYVKANGKKFVPHPKYDLSGVKELLKFSVKKRRQFFVFKPKNNWITILESDGNITFVDPAFALHLSRALKTRAIWFMFGGDFNVWAYQICDKGSVIEERFLPEDVFLGNFDDGDFGSYGDCYKFAEKFEKRFKLPNVFAQVPMKRTKKFNKETKEVIVKI